MSVIIVCDFARCGKVFNTGEEFVIWKNAPQSSRELHLHKECWDQIERFIMEAPKEEVDKPADTVPADNQASAQQPGETQEAQQASSGDTDTATPAEGATS